MRKIILSVLTAVTIYASESSLDSVKKEIEELPSLKNFGTKILDIKEFDKNWYVFKGVQDTQQGKIIFDAFSNKKVIIIGNGFDIKDGKPINIKTDFTQVKQNAAYTIGSGKTEYFLVTDPECPYCTNLEEMLPLLEKNAKIYVFLTGDIIPSHLASKGIVNYIESLPKEKRAKASREIFLEKDRSVTLKKIDKYNLPMYQMILRYKDNPDAKPIIGTYIKDLEKAFNVTLNSNDEIEAFIKEKITLSTKSITPELEKSVQEKRDMISMYFKPNGTPSVYKIDGKKLANQFQMFSETGTINLEKIKEIGANKELSITAGKIGAKKAYYFIGTQCSVCKDEFKDKEKLKKLLDTYEVHFLLTTNGSNYMKAEKELSYIYSQTDEKLKYKLLDAIMNGQELSMQELNMQYSKEYMGKISKYLGSDLMQTFVMGTPSIIDEDGKNIR